MRHRIEIGILLFCLGAPHAAIAAWSSLGLSDRWVHALELHGGVLYAGTRSGVHAHRLDAADTLWTSLGLEDREVLALLVFNPQTLLAGTEFRSVADTVSLYRTSDGGAHWVQYQNGFGSIYPEVRSLESLPGSDTHLFGAGPAGVEASTDGGQSWREVFAPGSMSVSNFVQVNPIAPTHVWAGGETLIFAPVMHRSIDAGAVWETFLLEAGGDNAADGIAFHPTDPDVIYIGMEGQVQRTLDGGATWNNVTTPNPALYFYGMAIPPRLPLRIYAGGGNMPAGRGFVLHKSDDGGDSWTPIPEPAGFRFGILTLLLISEGDADTLYLGTDRGVYVYREVASSVSAAAGRP